MLRKRGIIDLKRQISSTLHQLNSRHESSSRGNHNYGYRYEDNRAYQKIRRDWIHPYEKVYPWRSLSEFVDHLQDNIVYSDENILAIDKPWGVGIHTRQPLLDKKQNAYMIPMQALGDPKYCMDDALDDLSDRLNIKKLTQARAIDRYESGIVLYALNDYGLNKIKKLPLRALAAKVPFTTYWCICRGYPIIKGREIEEVIGITLTEVDEFGDYKEPVLHSQFTKSFSQKDGFKKGRIHMKILEVNKTLSTSLLEISTSSIKWRFVTAYAAQKSSFILGDNRFSKKVKQILGVPLILPSAKDVPGYDNYEPLSLKVRKKLLVPSNESIPLMLHHRKIIILNYFKQQPLVIQTDRVPRHFDWTLKKLDLVKRSVEDDSVDDASHE